MKTGIYDWTEIAEEFQRLKRRRGEMSDAASREIESLEQAINSVNKELDGFAFTLEENYGDDDPFSVIKIMLVELESKFELPCFFNASYFFDGTCQWHLLRPSSDDPANLLTRIEQGRSTVGVTTDNDWLEMLGKLARCNLKYTPRPID